ncbi:MAG: 30S ribosomal protein S12 methylthiotransferase RimO, partial [Clostridium saudiense]|nr:30S ribosomal protein S12 methylthiotransferase RimO [Clostridium saudiense]
VGVFAYSQEEDTPAAIMDGQIEENIKKERQNTLMAIQRDVVKEQIKLKIGNIYDTIIDSNNGEYFIGRNYEMAPEIDGLIYIKKHDGLSIGDIIKVKVTDVMEYDLIGEIFDELSK